jgi:predicted dehydrogenase
MTQEQYRVGIVGYGLSAKIFHIPYIERTPGFNLKAICQRTVTSANDAGRDHPAVDIFRNTEDLIQSPQVDVVVLCTPPTTHFTLTKRCLESGKHGVSSSCC